VRDKIVALPRIAKVQVPQGSLRCAYQTKAESGQGLSALVTRPLAIGGDARKSMGVCRSGR
jgi:hypothetical protein